MREREVGECGGERVSEGRRCSEEVYRLQELRVCREEGGQERRCIVKSAAAFSV